MKRIIMIILAALIMRTGAALERYDITVTATSDTITSRNTRGQIELLTVCKTEDKRTVLIESDRVQAGHTYIITLDRNETFNTEDDEIISVKAVIE